MLIGWQKKLLNNINKTLLEFEAGLHNIVLDSGKYRITLIGAGGASPYQQRVVTANPVILWEVMVAQGGVGGTVVVELNVNGTANLALQVGDTTGSRDTFITGLPGVTALKAGGGTNGVVSSQTSGTAGVMGVNDVRGSFELIETNNPNNVLSTTYYYAKIQNWNRAILVRLNTNYPLNTQLGASTKNGFIRIESI